MKSVYLNGSLLSPVNSFPVADYEIKKQGLVFKFKLRGGDVKHGGVGDCVVVETKSFFRNYREFYYVISNIEKDVLVPWASFKKF